MTGVFITEIALKVNATEQRAGLAWMVNLYINLTQPGHSKMAGKIMFGGMSVTVLLLVTNTNI